jgi:hypothetical protein
MSLARKWLHYAALARGEGRKNQLLIELMHRDHFEALLTQHGRHARPSHPGTNHCTTHRGRHDWQNHEALLKNKEHEEYRL